MLVFPRRLGRRAVSPVIGTILMVAITVVLAAVLYLMVSGMSPQPPPPASVMLETMAWNGGNNTAPVLSATGTTAIAPGDLVYIVRDADSNTYYAGRANNATTTGSITVNVRYEDRDGGNRITPGDVVVLSVSPESAAGALSGGVLELYYSNRVIGHHGIP